MNKLPVYELFLEDNEEIALALVNNPAIEKDFIYFDEQVVKMEFNKEQMTVKGPALIPNKNIYRNDQFGSRYVFMSEDTVKQFAEYLINKQGNKFNLGHTDNIIEANLLESYFTSETNEWDVPKGSWIVSLKLKSIEAWEQVKAGEFKGFSIEGAFSNELINYTNFNKNEMDLKEKLSAAINAVLFAVGAPADVAAPVEAPVEVPTKTEVTPEMVNEAITKAIEVVMQEVDAKLLAFEEKINGTQSEFKSQLEKFSNEPLSVPITEKVEIEAKGDNNPALRYF